MDGYLPIPVTVPTGATSVSITASGDWYYNENVPGSEGGPGGVPGTGQATLQEYMMTNLRSENITPCVCNLGSLVGMWYPDLRPTVTIGDAVAAAGGQEQFTVTLARRRAPSGWSYTVDYATQDGTGPDAALAGTDYTAKTGTLDFSAGHTSQTFTVDTDADGNATAGDLNFTVQLSDPSVADDGPATLNIVNGTGTGLIEPPVFNPTVSISSPDGSSNEFTVSYDGTREELDLSATVAASIAAQGDCYVVLPSVAGLEFWTAQTGGEQLTPDADGNLVYDAMPTSGEYSNTLWVCVDPNSPACAEFKTIPLTVELGSTEPSGLAGGVSPAAGRGNDEQGRHDRRGTTGGQRGRQRIRAVHQSGDGCQPRGEHVGGYCRSDRGGQCEQPPRPHPGGVGYDVYFNYPPVPETLEVTLAEVMRCTKAGITINTFLLDPDRGLQGFVEQLSRINRGRTFATSPDELGDYVLVDFLAHKTSAPHPGAPGRLSSAGRDGRRCRVGCPGSRADVVFSGPGRRPAD